MNEKEIALNLSKYIMDSDWEKVDSILSNEFIYEVDGRAAIGKAEYIGFMKNVLCNAFNEMEMNFKHLIAEGEFVAVNYSNAMTHFGDYMGIPASGKRVIATGQFIRQIQDGKIIAEWQTTNALGLINQIKN